ncbi:ATP-binding protein [Pantoea agglomerans]|uniref:ATP-binding protein n=1 Tax=Enterobacter agglomerans TaxID=549 RepID=UPI00289FA975|nr:ATP-binding protein [Pantoea agglomerans]WNK54513.1 ATP-binding protein [Pantoea agglomerans]
MTTVMTSQKRRTTNTDKSILGQISNMSPAKAVNEYIWNSFDAKAKNVSITVVPNGLSGISSIKVSDDGEGIIYSELSNTFDKFLDSKKVLERTPITRGRKGKGRFSFIKFADRASWLSWINESEFTIELFSSHINEYDVGFFLPSQRSGSGTEVSFSPVTDLDYDSFFSDVQPYIQNEISWLLLSGGGYEVTVNGVILQPIEHVKSSHAKSLGEHSFDIKTVQWSIKPVYEKSYIYFMNSKFEIVHKELSEMNRKGFHCSAYVSSEWFDTFDMNNSLLNGGYHSHESEVYKQIYAYVKNA